ncbi:hypothetical protein GGD50_003103 [Rhizobium paranaense]|uniref:Uncharacterized protein n=1 Tax=Rhizobium paranaense TaxID=1650438 RepID=A0A7W9D235_9HYPH|nr:hypothetical protein [Rhizobium paranaense]
MRVLLGTSNCGKAFRALCQMKSSTAAKPRLCAQPLIFSPQWGEGTTSAFSAPRHSDRKATSMRRHWLLLVLAAAGGGEFGGGVIEAVG